MLMFTWKGISLCVFYLSTVSTGIMLQPSSPWPDHACGTRLSLSILSCLLTWTLTEPPWEWRTTAPISCSVRKLLAFTEPNSTIRSPTHRPCNKSQQLRVECHLLWKWRYTKHSSDQESLLLTNGHLRDHCTTWTVSWHVSKLALLGWWCPRGVRWATRIVNKLPVPSLLLLNAG
jgi:hypothetical protein